MPRQHRLDPTSRSLMAKAYILGHERPADLARHYGVSASYVINTAKAWQTEQSLRRLKTLEKQLRQQIVPPPIEMPEPKLTFSKSGEWAIEVEKLGQHIRMPFVSIQHPKGS